MRIARSGGYERGFRQSCAETVARLRAPDGCPWDREQTNESLVPKLLEEAYEVAAAIREGDDENLREELGDVMLLIADARADRERARAVSNRAGAGGDHRKIDPPTSACLWRERKRMTPAAVVRLWDSVKREEKEGRR